VNENAADPPAEALEKDTNINSHTALANEATLLNQVYPAHILKSDEKVVFDNLNPFVEPPEETIPTAVSSGAERYRKWEMDDVNLVLRTRVHACMQTKNLVPAPVQNVQSSDLDLSETVITSLPNGLKIGGELDLIDCPNLISLPEDLKVGGDLFLYECKNLTSLPKGLQVGLKLYIGKTTLTNYSDDELRKMIKPGYISGKIYR
jgi:hypothetical protein